MSLNAKKNMHTFNIILSLICVLSVSFLCVSSAFALSKNDFMYEVELKPSGPAAGIYMAPLKVAVAERAAAGFADLRIFDVNGGEVPFVILNDVIPAEYVHNFYSMSVIDFIEGTDSVRLVMKMPEKRQPIEIIELDTGDRDFKKQVEIYGGNDNINWQKITEEPIFDFSSRIQYKKTDFKFDHKYDFTYYKFIIKNSSLNDAGQPSKSIKLKYEGLDFSVENFNETPLKINGVYAKTAFNVKKDATTAYDEKIFDKLNVKLDKSNNSVIDIPARLHFDRIVFDISHAYYKRAVKVYFSSNGLENSYIHLTGFDIYNIPLNEYNSSRCDFWYHTDKKNFYRFVIENGNNPPLTINKVKFEMVHKNIFFVPASPSPFYYMRFGNPSLKASEYDVSSFIHQDNWYKQQFTKIQTGEIIYNEEYKEEKKRELRPEVEKALLSVIVIIVIAALCYWLFNLLSAAAPEKKENEGGSQTHNGACRCGCLDEDADEKNNEKNEKNS